jgi:hypothetical protein
MKNLQLTKFNLRFGNKKEAELFMQKYKELQLPVSILGQSFFIEDKEFIFIGLTEIKSNSLVILNKVLYTNYKNNINNYNAVFMSAKELSIPNNYYFRSKHIYKSEYLLTLNLKEFINRFSSTF